MKKNGYLQLNKKLARGAVYRYNKGMTRLTLLSLALLGGMTAVGQQAEASVAQSKQTEAALQQVLDAMVKTNDEDFYEAARVVWEGTADETAFLPMMQAAAKRGNAAAIMWEAMYELTLIGNDDAAYKKVLKQIELAAKKKYAPAMVALSQLSPKESSDEAKKWLMEACKSGNSKARALYLLQSGRLNPDKLSAPEVASELKKGNHYLEELVASAQSTEADAVKWMLLAESHGSPTAPYLLSQAATKADEALKHLLTAVERHNVMALYLYGVLLHRADTLDVALEMGLKKDNATARKHLAIAAMLLSPDAAATLGRAYANGDMPAVPAERICRLFEYAHRCGVNEGSAGLGYCMVMGAGCPRNEEKGMELMLKARDSGALWVNQALASIYFNGAGSIKPNMRKALDALAADAAAGSVYAYAMMAGLSALGNADAKPDTTAAQVYMKFALTPNPRVDIETNKRVAEQSKKTYDAILTSKTWVFFPALLKSAE